MGGWLLMVYDWPTIIHKTPGFGIGRALGTWVATPRVPGVAGKP